MKYQINDKINPGNKIKRLAELLNNNWNRNLSKH